MTLTLSSREVALVAQLSRALMSPGAPILEPWWAQTGRALLELFAGDHAMCMLPGVGLLARHVDGGVLDRLATVSTSAGLRRLDPVYFDVNAVCTQTAPYTWNRVRTLRDAAVARRRASPVYEVFRAAGIAESANVDFTTSHGRAGLCVSFERTDARIERSRMLAQLLAPSFEAGVQAFVRRAPICDPDGVLTPREREIADLLVRRRMNREIAASLGLSEHTVRHHIENIFSKLGVRSRRDVAVRLRVPRSDRID